MADTEYGVFYAESDYVTFFRRLLIDLIDGVILLLLWAFSLVVIAIAAVPAGLASKALIAAMLGSSFFYLVVLKRFARTLGYIALGAQVVSMRGAAPSLWSLSVRALFLFVGPANTLLDIIWLTSDPDRQAIRDKFARTYVIRAQSTPVGRGRIRYVRMDLLGIALLLPEVVKTHAEPSALPEPTVPT